MILKYRSDGFLHGIKISRDIAISHLLLFVDDVLLFGLGSREKWQSFRDIIQIFCEASGMEISSQKSTSTFLHLGVSDEVLFRILALFPYLSESLDGGFKYLGYFLKPNNYATSDWFWMLKKIEGHINHWINRYLSLGGCLNPRCVVASFWLNQYYKISRCSDSH